MPTTAPAKRTRARAAATPDPEPSLERRLATLALLKHRVQEIEWELEAIQPACQRLGVTGATCRMKGETEGQGFSFSCDNPDHAPPWAEVANTLNEAWQSIDQLVFSLCARHARQTPARGL